MEIQLMMFGLPSDTRPIFRGAYLEDLQTEAIAIDLFGSKLAYGRNGGPGRMLCPRHEEKTPSFFLRPKYNGYRCFGCGAIGGPITFLEEFYWDPLRYLEQKSDFDRSNPKDVERFRGMKRKEEELIREIIYGS